MRVLAVKPKATPKAGAAKATPESTKTKPGYASFSHDFGRTAIFAKGTGEGWVQPKLWVGTVDDPLEREADEIAHRVTCGPDDAVVRLSRSESTLALARSVHHVTGSAGQPLDSVARKRFEAQFGFDFSQVRIHADAQANESADDMGAKAYTVGEHLAFAKGQYAPETAAGQRLLAHELVHVVQQGAATGFAGVQSGFAQARPALRTGRILSRQPAAPAALLTPRQARDAAADVNKTFDENSIRLVKFLARLTPGGSFSASDAEALAQEQKRGGQPPTGRITKAFMDFLLPQVSAEVPQNALLRLVIQHAKLNVSQALAVRFDPAISTESDVAFVPGGVAEVRVGTTAFASYDTMVAAIRKQLAKKPPAGTTTTVPKAVLDKTADQTKAIAADKAKLTDPRLIRIVQGVVGNKSTGKWDVDTVRHIAALQQTAGLTPDGTLDDKTLEALVKALVTSNNQDAALHLLIGFYKLNPTHAFSIRFDPAFRPPPSDPSAVAETTGLGMGVGGVVRMGQGILTQPLVNIVHTLAHELGHVEQVIGGITSLPEREFLSRVIQIRSLGIPALPIESATDIALLQSGGSPASKGFLVLANQTLHFWGLLSTDRKRANLRDFRAIRQIVINRASSATQLAATLKSALTSQWTAADAGL